MSKDHSGASPEELKPWPVKLERRGQVSAEGLNAKPDNIREDTGSRAKSASDTEPELNTEDLEKKLSSYKPQYEKLDSHSKSRFSWEEVKTSLLANNGHYLRLTDGLNNGGVLFGVDDDDNLLFADEGDEPIMTNMNYPDTRNRVLYKYQGDEMIMEGGEPLPTGYEMFPPGELHTIDYSADFEKSEEIDMYEENTGKPIVASSDRKGYRELWLETGEYDPSRHPLVAYYDPLGHATALMAKDVRNDPHFPERGTRRLLRVPKTA